VPQLAGLANTLDLIITGAPTIRFAASRCVSSGLAAPGNQLANLGLLLRRELWPASSDASFAAASVQAGFGAFPQHSSFALSAMRRTA
jgi:hypothetical protein